MGHRRYVPQCPFRNAIAVFMSAVTLGAWIPFTNANSRVPDPPEEDEFSVPAPVFEAHAPISWPEQVVPHPPGGHPVPPHVAHGATRHSRPEPNPATDPTYSKPTPKVRVKQHVVPPVPARETAAQELVAYLRAQVGKPYILGGNGPFAFDCSGLTKAAFAHVGIFLLPRTSEEQSLVGERVPLGDLRVGDLLFYGLPGEAFHVAVYVGDGKAIAAQNLIVGVIEYALEFYPPSFARRVL